MFASLRIRFLLLLSALIAVMATYMVVRGHEQRRAAIERLRTDIHSHAEFAMHRQEDVIANGRLVLEAVATTPEIREPLSADCSAELAELLHMRPRFLNIAILDPSGTVDCSAASPNRSVNLAGRPSFDRALETGGFAVGEYQIDRTAGTQFLDLALPVRDRDGKVSAVIVTAFDLAWLGDSIGSRLLPAGSAVDIIRSDGTLVARYPVLRELTGRSILGTELYTAIQSHGFSGGFETIGLDGIRRLYEVFNLQTSRGASAGYTVIGIPDAAAIEAIDEQLRLELIDLAAVGLLLLLGGYIASDALVARPIKTLIAMSRKIGAGHRRVRSGLDSNMGEISALATSMDRMAAAIEDYEGQITRRQRQLADSQEFAKLFSWRWTPGSSEIEVSDSIFSILGVTADSWELSFESLLKSVHPDDRDQVNEAVARAIESKSAYLVEYRAVRPDGEVREFWDRGRCELDGNGEVVAVSGIVQDITPLKEAEREGKLAMDALRKSEEQFRSAIEVSPVGMALLAPDGAWMFVNDALCRVVGYSAQDLLATSLQTITHPSDRKGEVDPVLQTLNYENDNYQAERRLVGKDGRTAWVLLSASLVRGSSGTPRYFILQMHDISERKPLKSLSRRVRSGTGGCCR